MNAPDVIPYQFVIWTLLWRASGGAAGLGIAASYEPEGRQFDSR